MAIKTVSFQRTAAECDVVSSGTAAGLKTAIDAFFAAKLADTTKTFTVRTVNAYHDGTNHVAVLEASYPEINDAGPESQVPELP